LRGLARARLCSTATISMRRSPSLSASGRDGSPPGVQRDSRHTPHSTDSRNYSCRIAVAAVVRPIAVAGSVVRRCGIGIGRIAIAAIVRPEAVANGTCGACVNCAPSCAAICPPVDARYAQSRSWSTYAGISTVDRQRHALLRPLKCEGNRSQ